MRETGRHLNNVEAHLQILPVSSAAHLKILKQ